MSTGLSSREPQGSSQPSSCRASDTLTATRHARGTEPHMQTRCPRKRSRLTYKTGFCRAELAACTLGVCTGELRGLGSDTGPWPSESWGSCSRVSWSRRLVSWISRSIWGQVCTGEPCEVAAELRGEASTSIIPSCPALYLSVCDSVALPRPEAHSGWACR